MSYRSDDGGEFLLTEFQNFFEEHGIKRQYYTTNTQQNGITERKNRIVQEAARTMLLEEKVAEIFWREAVGVVVYIINIAQLRVNIKNISYELWIGRSAPLGYFKIFGSKCYIKK